MDAIVMEAIVMEAIVMDAIVMDAIVMDVLPGSFLSRFLFCLGSVTCLARR
jgi:hypothetical protein